MFKSKEVPTTGSQFADLMILVTAIVLVMYAVIFGCAFIASILVAIGVNAELAGIVYLVLYLASILSGFVFETANKVYNVVVKAINAVTSFDFTFGLSAKFKAA